MDFTKQDDTPITKEEDTYKYTKIDTLDEDDPFEPSKGKCYALVSFISPEGLLNCKVRGIKIRGFFYADSEEEFKKEGAILINKIRRKDKYFDVFVQEVGKWCPWDPNPLDKSAVKETEYDTEKLNKMMKSVQEHKMKDLNEIVGRRKEELDKSEKAHKQRIGDTMKDNSKITHDGSSTKEKLKKKFEQKEEEKIKKEVREPKIEEIPQPTVKDLTDKLEKLKEKLKKKI